MLTGKTRGPWSAQTRGLQRLTTAAVGEEERSENGDPKCEKYRLWKQVFADVSIKD